MVIPPITEIVYQKIDFIVGLLIGGAGTLVSWYNRKKELRATLYYPLWLACCNLLLLFNKINKYETDETRGKELFNSAVQPLSDIMYNYGTAVQLKGKLEESGEDYLSIFFRVKNIIDLNQTSVNSNWALAVRWFKKVKEGTYSVDDDSLIDKIKEFEGLYKDLKNLKEFCESKDKSLRGKRI
jgi:hypothetical protein